MIEHLFKEITMNHDFYFKLLMEHIFITLIAIFIAVILGITIGVWISYRPKLANWVIAFVNVVYTIPSIALLGFLISFSGVGNTTAIIALTIYALLPIVRSTYVGITHIDPMIIEASEAMGSTPFQILYLIKLPLAFPIIFSAIMNMVTMTIALAGIASFVGAGGLGVAIYRGITTNNDSLMIVGSVLIALLALVAEALLFAFKSFVMSHRFKQCKFKKLIIPAILLVSVISMFSVSEQPMQKFIELASKPTTEEYILAEMVAALVEQDTDVTVHITHGVGGGTSNIHPAMVKGEFDIYPEYTGTAWQVVLKRREPYTDEQFGELQKFYKDQFNFDWTGMFGFNSTYSLGIRKELADKYQIKTFSDLAKHANELTFAAEYDFFEREDGYKTLTDAYQIGFKKAIDMDNGLKYAALFEGRIDVMTVFTTDGQLSDPRVVVLEDDLSFYPRYLAGLVIREEILAKYPELNQTLEKFNGLIDESTMAKLNYQVEIDKKQPKAVAREFLMKKGLLGGQHE